MSNNLVFSWERYKKSPIVGIVRGIPLETVLRISQAYLDAGFYTLEITMNTIGAAEIISKLRDEFPDLNVGAGTVCTIDDLKKAIDAGAQFIVTPIIVEEVIVSSVAQGVPIFPGAFTPTEIYKAWSLGASAVKIFPATQLGVQYINDVSASLSDIKLLPTGGISLENIKSYFEGGTMGVGMGSSLFDMKLIQEGNFEGLRDHFCKIKLEIQEFIKT